MSWVTAELIVSADDRPAWLEARRTRLTSTDIAKAMTPSGWAQVVNEKLYGAERADNVWFAHGREREDEIARKAEAKFGIEANRYLYDGQGLSATPDGIGRTRGELGEYKTSLKPLPATFPRVYRDQVYVAQHVMGATRTLIGWERHHNGVPLDLEPTWLWIGRDETRIQELLTVAHDLADFLETERLTLAH